MSRGRWILVKVSPQGNLGWGETCVVRKSMGGAVLSLPSVRGGGHDLMVRGDGEVAGKKLTLGICTIKTG